MNNEDLEILKSLVEKYGIVEITNQINKDSDYEDTMNIIKYWKYTAKQYFGISPYVNYGKTITMLKRNLKQLKRQDIENIIEFYCQWYTESNDRFSISLDTALSEWFINKYMSEKEKYGN